METVETRKKFRIRYDKQGSQAMKGIAILVMMLHHCFRDASLFEDYTIDFSPFEQDYVVSVALMCKICVSLFAFISGYGLYLDYRSKAKTGDRWAASRYIKSFSGYWMIWIFTAYATELLDGRYHTTFYEESVNAWDSGMHVALDFFGLSNLFHTPTLNGTWWYMTAAFFFIIITPIVMKHEDYILGILFFSCFILRVMTGSGGEEAFTGGNSTWSFLSPFLFGMVFAKYDLIERITNARGRILRLFLWPLLIHISFLAYDDLAMKVYWELRWGVMPLFLILFCAEFINSIPGIRQILAFLGKHSMNIFMIHTMLRGYYAKDFIYSQGHFLKIVGVLLAYSLVISIVLELFKKGLFYDRIIQFICKRINDGPRVVVPAAEAVVVAVASVAGKPETEVVEEAVPEMEIETEPVLEPEVEPEPEVETEAEAEPAEPGDD